MWNGPNSGLLVRGCVGLCVGGGSQDGERGGDSKRQGVHAEETNGRGRTFRWEVA